MTWNGNTSVLVPTCCPETISVLLLAANCSYATRTPSGDITGEFTRNPVGAVISVRAVPAASMAWMVVPTAPVPLTKTISLPSGVQLGSNSSAGPLRPLGERARGDVHHPDVVAPGERPVRGEGDARPVGREARLAIVAVPVGQLVEAAPVGLHHPDVEGARGVGLERHQVSGGRPVRPRGLEEVVGDLPSLAAPDGERPERALEVHDHRPRVGRDGGGDVGALAKHDGVGEARAAARNRGHSSEEDGRGHEDAGET